MKKLAEFIVNKRLILLFVFVGVIVYCAFGIPKIKVEYDITQYLPGDTDTAKAIAVMDKEFAALGSATFLVENVTPEQAEDLATYINGLDGVSQLSFDPDSTSNYKDGHALFNVFFTGGSDDKRAVVAYGAVTEHLKKGGYAFCVPTPLVDNYAETLSDEMTVIIAIAAAVIIAVLLFTSKSFAEVLAFPIVFGVAAVLNMGTNYWLGKISFVSNTVCIILQLALAIDYAIILCHRFTEEKDKRPGDPQTALVAALTKAIPEIASSSLTTVSGLVALMFMQLGLGFDLGMVLAKSIVCSLLTVFFLMPCILLWLSKLMDKTRHRSFVPKVRFLGCGVVKIRYAVVAVFAVLFGVGAWLSQNVTFCYSQNSIDTSRPTETMSAQDKQGEIFGISNAFVILVPKTTEPEIQRLIIDTVSAEPLIDSALGWAAVKLPSRTDPKKSYYLTDRINSSDLSDMTGIDENKTRTLFALYALSHGGFGGVPVDDYRVIASDLFEYVFADGGIADIVGPDIAALKKTLEFGKSQLVGEEHYRLVFNIAASVESPETFALIERLTSAVKNIDKNAVFAGSAMSAYDLNGSFTHDNILITVLTVAFVFLILAFTFRSWGIPIVLVAVIQGAIFMNFSLPVITGGNLFFFVYLIASAIQMGATIDYAILLTNRFRMYNASVPRKTAVVNAVSEAFPTIMTSGTIMTVAAYLVGSMTTDPLISSMGMTLGTGTLISIASVLTALPALLYILSPLLEKTAIGKRRRAKDIKMPNPSVPPDGTAFL